MLNGQWTFNAQAIQCRCQPDQHHREGSKGHHWSYINDCAVFFHCQLRINVRYRYSDFTIYVPRVHIPDARWLDGRVKWTRPQRGGPISEASRSRSSGGWGRRAEGGGEPVSWWAGVEGREGRAALGLRRAGIAPGENGTLRRRMVQSGKVGWDKTPTLKINATYLFDYRSVGLLWPKLGVFTLINFIFRSLTDML